MRKFHSLVWVQGLKGPEPQIWAPDAFEVHPSRLTSILAVHEITEEEHQKLDLFELAARHPIGKAAQA